MHSQDEDQRQQSQLNESRFLIEELNLDEQPKQEEILERAEELEIDDLILARESLTKQLDPEWKPYCNRYSQIYYINLVEKIAYLDHPIDMYYKQLYAKNNGMPVPRFRSFKLSQISQSLDLIEDEIRNFQRSHKTTLRIVYQQPSQEQALSSHLKSPANNNQDLQNESQIPVQQLTLNQVQNLHQYQQQLQQKQYQQYLKKKKEIRMKQMAKEEAHEETLKFILERRIQEICETYQDQLMRKNKVSLAKQDEKMELQYQSRRMDFCDSIQKFNQVFEKLRDKQRNVSTLYQNKNAFQRTMAIANIKLKSDYEKHKAASLAQDKMKQQFGQKLVTLFNQNERMLQESLAKTIQDIQSQPNIVRKMNEKSRKPLFSNKILQEKKPQADLEYQQLKKQIRELNLWESEQLAPIPRIERGRTFNQSSLNLKLRMRVI